MTPRLAAMLGAATLTVLAAGCLKPDVDAACDDAPEALVAALDGHLADGGNVRFPVVLQPDDAAHLFFSFENRTDDEVADDESGVILTLLAPSAGSLELAAVGERARDDTDFPDADVDMRADGAVRSRGCVAAKRQQD